MVTIMCFWTLFWIIDLSQHSPPSYTLPNIIINMSSWSGWGNIMGVGLVDKQDYKYSKEQVFFPDTGTASPFLESLRLLTSITLFVASFQEYYFSEREKMNHNNTSHRQANNYIIRIDRKWQIVIQLSFLIGTEQYQQCSLE